MSYSLGKWSNGLAEWIEGDTAFLSIAFTWKLDEAFARASMLKAEGYRVRAGGPAKLRRLGWTRGVDDRYLRPRQ